MKKYFTILLLSFLFFSCEKEGIVITKFYIPSSYEEIYVYASKNVTKFVVFHKESYNLILRKNNNPEVIEVSKNDFDKIEVGKYYRGTK